MDLSAFACLLGIGHAEDRGQQGWLQGPPKELNLHLENVHLGMGRRHLTEEAVDEMGPVWDQFRTSNQ